MITGREALEEYPKLSKKKLLEWCKAGHLQPFKKYDWSIFTRDPKSPDGYRRVFPPGELEGKYELLRLMYNKLHDLESARETDTDSVPQEEEAEKTRLLSEIEELEQDLTLERVWGNTRLDFSEVCTLLMESYYRLEDVDKLPSSIIPGRIAQPMVSIRKKRQDQEDHETVETWALDYFKQFEQTPDAIPALIDVMKIAQREVEAAKPYSERTLLDWIRPLHPQYTSNQPGRKKGRKKVRQ